jgi:hypothetical protein
MRYLIWGVLLSILAACTYSITMVHTEGEAADVVDETATNSPDISPEITVPASVI